MSLKKSTLKGKIKKSVRRLIITFLVLSTTHCFGALDKRGSVVGYKQGFVKTQGGQFRIGTLSELWQKKKIKTRALLFQNTQDLATITISSWCHQSADEVTLLSLTDELYAGIENLQTLEAKEILMGSRRGHQSTVVGRMDQQDVWLKTVVLKMNTCVFDFLYVTTPDHNHSVVDFDQMVAGFEYLEGPQIL